MGKLIDPLSVFASPTIFILDANGVIRFKFVGRQDAELDKAVNSLLAEPKA